MSSQIDYDDIWLKEDNNKGEAIMTKDSAR